MRASSGKTFRQRLAARRPRLPKFDRRGSVLPLVALVTSVLIGCAGLAVDGARLMLMHSKLQAAVDADVRFLDVLFQRAQEQAALVAERRIQAAA